MKIIDMHSHYIPKIFIDEIEGKDNNKFQAKIIKKHGQKFISHDQGYTYPCLPEFYDRSVKLEKMSQSNVDITVLSSAPPLFYYWADKDLAIYMAQMVNDELLNFVNEMPDKFRMMATVPMGDPESAAKELERIVSKSKGLARFVQIGTTIEGKLLDNKEFEPFFSKAEDLDITVFLHPYYVGDKPGLENYYLTNLVGNPYDTTIAAVNLMFSGFMEKYPKLKICLAHGGGYLPYQIGRLQHGYQVREEPKLNGASEPSKTISRFYFDTITFEKKAVEYLVNLVGSEKVMLGSDFPFDMGDEKGVEMVKSMNINEANKRNILSYTAGRLLGIE